MTIYNADSSIIFEAPITKSAIIKRELMGDFYIQLAFNTSEALSIPIGSYVEYEGLYFTVLEKVTPTRPKGKRGYKYDIKFYASQHKMKSRRLSWINSTRKELTFNLTTDIATFAKLVADNMLSTGQYWVRGSYPETTEVKALSFDGESCWDAVDKIAKAFAVEWWVEEEKGAIRLCFGTLAKGDFEVFKEGDVISYIEPIRGESQDYGTRFFVFGGTRNIPADYYESQQGGVTNHLSEKRLHLPQGIEYIDAYGGLTQDEIIEQVVRFDHIFPKNTETITSVEEVTRTINGEEHLAYIITCANSDFDHTDKANIIDDEIGASFTSGSLNGREFRLNYDKQNLTKKYEIVANTESAGGDDVVVIPNEYLKPVVGDTFVLTGVKLPVANIEAAENELLAEGEAYVTKNSSDTKVYNCDTNPIYCEVNSINYDLGQNVQLVGAAFGKNGRTSRIQGYEKSLANPYVATYSVGDNRRYTRYGAIASTININVLKQSTALVAINESNTLRVQRLATTAQTTALKASEGLSANEKALFAIDNRLKIVESNTSSTDISALKLQVQENTQELGTLNETVVPVLIGRLGQAETTLETLTETTIPTLSQQALAAANTAKSEAIQESKNYVDTELAGKADLENGKIPVGQLPDYILGQMLFGGTLDGGTTSQMTVTPTANLLDKIGKTEADLNTEGKLVITNTSFETYEGVYFISSINFGNTNVVNIPDVRIGDWIISTGTNWRKVDNTDAVSSVAELTGVITASALAEKLAATGDANELALKSEVDDNADASAKAIQSLQNQITNNTNGIAGLAGITDNLDNRIKEHEGSLTDIKRRLIAVERTDVELRVQVTANSERLAAVESSNNVQLPEVRIAENGGRSYSIDSGVATVFTTALTEGATFQLQTSDTVNGVDNVWVIRFGIGASNTGSYNITSDDTFIYSFKWANGIAPTFENGKYYELSFRLIGQKFLGTWTSFGN